MRSHRESILRFLGVECPALRSDPEGCRRAGGRGRREGGEEEGRGRGGGKEGEEGGHVVKVS